MPTFAQDLAKDSTGIFAIKNEVVDFVTSDDLKDKLIEYGTNIVFAILILVVGWWLAKAAGKGVRKVLTRSKTDAGLITFLSSLAVISMKIMVLITAINQLGVQMTSFITILGAAGLAIGMAFSGTLSNFAGGVMILFFKPFKVGDTILALTQQGKVTEIQIFYTYLYTSDNKVVVLPNGPLANGNLVNFTKEKKRRAEWMLTLARQEDYVVVYQEIKAILSSEKRILKKPETLVAIHSIEKGLPQVVVRAWVATDDLSDVTFTVNEALLKRLNELSIPLKTE